MLPTAKHNAGGMEVKYALYAPVVHGSDQLHVLVT
jgi:hypothetical protein